METKKRGIRQVINAHPVVTGVGAALLAAIALTFAVRQVRRATVKVPTKAFFTVDDGKTYFADDLEKIPPWDHGGVPAYRCRVFRCGDAPPFVNHMETYDPAVKSKIEARHASSGLPIAQDMVGFSSSMKVRRPGDKEWVTLSQDRQRFGDIIRPDPKACPPDQVKPVLPE